MSTFLDVDDNYLKEKFTITDMSGCPEDRAITQLMPEQPPSVMDIQPLPGACVKTHNEGDGRKVFVNVCTCDQIAAPDDVTDAELIEILESEEPSSFRIPMSVGAGHAEVDKGGQACTAYDVVVHPAFFKKTQDSPIFHNFFVVTTMEVLDQKYGLTLDKNGWKVLRKKTYLGVIPSQRVRTTRPLIQEVTGRAARRGSETSDSVGISAAQSPDAAERYTDPEQRSTVDRTKHKPLLAAVEVKKTDNSQGDSAVKPSPTDCVIRRLRDINTGVVTAVRVEVALPGTCSGIDTTVLVSEERCVLETSTHYLDTHLPYTTDPDNAVAHFVKDKQSLYITLPVVVKCV